MTNIISTETIEIDNDNKIFLHRTNPSGLIHMELETGELPEKYRGRYTDYEGATLDAKRYISERIDALKDTQKK